MVGSGLGNNVTWHATIIMLFVMLVAGGVGLPFPEDLTLLGAGALAQPGLLRLTDVVFAGFAGVVTADWILYGIGRRYGADLVGHPRLGRLLGVHRIDAVRDAVMRHQARAIFFARFVLGTRIITFLAAGTFGVSPVRFALAEAAGSAIFVPAMATSAISSPSAPYGSYTARVGWSIGSCSAASSGSRPTSSRCVAGPRGRRSTTGARSAPQRHLEMRPHCLEIRHHESAGERLAARAPGDRVRAIRHFELRRGRYEERRALLPASPAPRREQP